MFKNILVHLDAGQEDSWRKALPDAVKLARAFDATLHIMTVVPDFGSSWVSSYFPADFEKKTIDHAHQHLQELVAAHVPDDVRHHLIVAHGRVHTEVERVARDCSADLVVMGSHKPEFSDIILTPPAEQVLHHVNVSVMIVRD